MKLEFIVLLLMDCNIYYFIWGGNFIQYNLESKKTSTLEDKMKSYGMKGDMNPQSKQKADMTPSNHYKGKMDKKGGNSKGAHDMSPKVKVADQEAVWQNMRG